MYKCVHSRMWQSRVWKRGFTNVHKNRCNQRNTIFLRSSSSRELDRDSDIIGVSRYVRLLKLYYFSYCDNNDKKKITLRKNLMPKYYVQFLIRQLRNIFIPPSYFTCNNFTCTKVILSLMNIV